MFPPHPTELLHLLLQDEIAAGDLAIDATAGNGYDAVFLAKAVGETGKVLAIDIQPEAIKSTAARLEREGLSSRVTLHLANHTDMASLANKENPAVILFNLGYLPGGDRTVITHTESTLKALAAAAAMLKPSGMLSVICYPGHDGGDDEAAAAAGFISSLPGYRTARYGMIPTGKHAPFLLLSRKPG